MALTTAQKTTFKADIIAASDPACIALEASPTNSDFANAVAALYNANASPDYWVYKTNATLPDIGNAIVATELAGLTSLNVDRLSVIAQYAPSGINPSLADRRAAFDDIFSGAGGANTRTALAVLWRRLGRRVEKLLKTAGDGSTGTPATLGYEGPLSYQDVLDTMAVA
jgi:hypothetical protein